MMSKNNYRTDWYWWDYLESWWYIYFWNWFSKIPKEAKWFLQRGMRGWANCDVWEMHHYLTDVILNMLVVLKRDKQGCPNTLNEKTGEYDYDEERWNKLLDEMIDGFAILKKADSHENINYAPELPDDKRKVIEKGMQEKYPTWRFTTKDEEAKAKRAFELLHRYYCSLWD